MPAAKKKTTKKTKKKVAKKVAKRTAKKRPGKRPRKAPNGSRTRGALGQFICEGSTETNSGILSGTDLLKKISDIFGSNPIIKGFSARDIAKRKAVYLQTYLETSRNDVSAAAAGVPMQTFYIWKKNDPIFAEAYATAKEVSIQNLEDAAVRRGVHGTLKPIYQGGALVGHERRYSDSMLSILLKGNAPDKYRDRISVGGDGKPIIHENRGLTTETADAIRADILGIRKKGDDDDDEG